MSQMFQILCRASSDEWGPDVEYILVEFDVAEAKQYVGWYELAESLRKSESQLRSLEFFPSCADAFDELPPGLESIEGIEDVETEVFDNGYLVLKEAYDVDGEDASWLSEHRLRLDYTTLHIDVSHPDMPSFCGFRWEVGVKHCSGSASTLKCLSVGVLRELVDGVDRCEHGMFFSGAGACPQCGGGAE